MRTFLFLTVSAAVLAGLWFFLKPPPATPDAVDPDRPAVFSISIRDGQVSGPAVLSVQQGSDVRIEVSSDRPDELHLHGYDLQAELQPGITATLAFTAVHSGRFELELHGDHHGIGTLEVHPSP